MVLWGTISTATAGVQTYGGLVAVRFFLGFVEAAYFVGLSSRCLAPLDISFWGFLLGSLASSLVQPGCLYFLSAWYTRKELGFRTAMLYSGSLISGAFSGLVAAGITGNMDHKRGLRAWYVVFLLIEDPR